MPTSLYCESYSVRFTKVTLESYIINYSTLFCNLLFHVLVYTIAPTFSLHLPGETDYDDDDESYVTDGLHHGQN